MNESVERIDCGSNADGATSEYIGAEAATVDQAAAASSQTHLDPVLIAPLIPGNDSAAAESLLDA